MYTCIYVYIYVCVFASCSCYVVRMYVCTYGSRRHRNLGEGHFGAGHFPNFYLPFPNFFFSSYEERNNEAGNFLNAVEREPVETRVLNPTTSEASYKPKQRSYRKTKQFLFFLLLYFNFKIRIFFFGNF